MYNQVKSLMISSIPFSPWKHGLEYVRVCPWCSYSIVKKMGTFLNPVCTAISSNCYIFLSINKSIYHLSIYCSIYLSTYLSKYPSILPSIYHLFIYMLLAISLSLSRSLFLSLFLSLSLSLSLSLFVILWGISSDDLVLCVISRGIYMDDLMIERISTERE